MFRQVVPSRSITRLIWKCVPIPMIFPLHYIPKSESHVHKFSWIALNFWKCEGGWYIVQKGTLQAYWFLPCYTKWTESTKSSVYHWLRSREIICMVVFVRLFLWQIKSVIDCDGATCRNSNWLQTHTQRPCTGNGKCVWISNRRARTYKQTHKHTNKQTNKRTLPNVLSPLASRSITRVCHWRPFLPPCIRAWLAECTKSTIIWQIEKTISITYNSTVSDIITLYIYIPRLPRLPGLLSIDKAPIPLTDPQRGSRR